MLRLGTNRTFGTRINLSEAPRPTVDGSENNDVEGVVDTQVFGRCVRGCSPNSRAAFGHVAAAELGINLS